MYNVAGCPPSDHYTISQIGGSIVPGTTDIGNHGDDTVTTIALPFAYTLYDQTFTNINLSSNGNAQFTTTDTAFTNQCLPWTTHNYTVFPYWDDLYLVNAGFGIFTSVSGTAPNRVFNIEWRAQYFPGTGSANFEARFFEATQKIAFVYGTISNGSAEATVGLQGSDTARRREYSCHTAGTLPSGREVDYNISADIGNDLQRGQVLAPGTDFVPGSDCDDCLSSINLPFQFLFDGQPYTTVNASANGNLQFNTSTSGDDLNSCLPASDHGRMAAPYWDDLYGVNPGYGIYTATFGTAPNRQFVIEWRMQYFPGSGSADLEAILYEGTNNISFLYG